MNEISNLAPIPSPKALNKERVAKYIARAGLGSRREVEAWILDGRVTVNGALITSPALNVSSQDTITVDGTPLPQRERTRLWLYHKPRGYITTQHDPEGRPTVFSILPEHLPRVVSVGRLDINTEGLLLLTNDGALAGLLENPRTGWSRRYRVRAFGTLTQDYIDQMAAGMTVDGIHYGPIETHIDRDMGENVWLTMALTEGKNREIKNVLKASGLEVGRLIRVSYGPFRLKDLPEGAVEEIPLRILKEQISPRMAADAGLDFESPLHPISIEVEPKPTHFNRQTRSTDKPKPIEKPQMKATRKAAQYAAAQAGEPMAYIDSTNGKIGLNTRNKPNVLKYRTSRPQKSSQNNNEDDTTPHHKRFSAKKTPYAPYGVADKEKSKHSAHKVGVFSKHDAPAEHGYKNHRNDKTTASPSARFGSKSKPFRTTGGEESLGATRYPSRQNNDDHSHNSNSAEDFNSNTSRPKGKSFGYKANASGRASFGAGKPPRSSMRSNRPQSTGGTRGKGR